MAKKGSSVPHGNIELPPGMKVVTTPIEAPTRGRNGYVINTLRSVVKLGPTSIETGLSPHIEWSCTDVKQMRSRATTLQAARKRLAKEDKQYQKLSFMQRANSDKGDYRIYIWLEE